VYTNSNTETNSRNTYINMFSSKTFKEQWKPRLENLKKRFPEKSEETIKNALIKYRGHAGHVAKFLSPPAEMKKKISHDTFVHAAEISGKFVFTSTQSSEDTSFADKLKTLREKLGDPIMSFEKGNHKMKWRFAMYNDNDSLEEELKIERNYFGRSYSEFYACEMGDVLNASPIRTSPDIEPWKYLEPEYEKLHRMFRGANGKMSMWDKGKEEAFAFGSVRYEAVMRSKRIVVEWDINK
jgi:hypothetical protein